MFCPNCGTSNPDTSTFCSSCGSALKPTTASAQPTEQKLPLESFLATSQEYLKEVRSIRNLCMFAVALIILAGIGFLVGMCLWYTPFLIVSIIALGVSVPIFVFAYAKETKLKEIKAPQMYQKYLSE